MSAALRYWKRIARLSNFCRSLYRQILVIIDFRVFLYQPIELECSMLMQCEEESKGKLWWTDEKNHKMIKFPPMVQYKSHSGSHLLLSLCKRSVDSSSGISISSPSLHCTRTRAIQCDALQSIAIRESVYEPYRIFTTSFNMHFTMQTAIKNQ